MKAGWEVKPLEEVCDFKGGSQPPKSQFISEPKEGYIRMLQIRDFKSDDKAVYIPMTSKTNACEAEDIMIGRYGASVGQIHRGKAGAYNVALIRTIPDLNQIDRDFLYHYLTSDLFQKPLMSVSKRGAQDGFSKPDIAPFPFPIPPLEEQKRIVAVLDAAFEGLTRAKENAEANLQSARELFEAFLEELFLKNGKNWSAAALQDTVTEECTLSYGIVQPGDDVEGGLPVVRPTDLGTPLISRSGLKTIAPEKAGGYARTRLVGDEILLCVRGTTGVVAKALPELEGGNVTRGIVPIRFDGRKMLQDFGYYQFRSRHIQDQIEAQTYGAALRQINIRDLRKLNFVFPDVTEQEELLPMLQDTQKNCDELVELNQAKLTDIADLRQSLLQEAFAGQLT